MAMSPTMRLTSKTLEKGSVIKRWVPKDEPKYDCVFIGQGSLCHFPDWPVDGACFIEDDQDQLPGIVQPCKGLSVKLAPGLEVCPVSSSVFSIFDAYARGLH